MEPAMEHAPSTYRTDAQLLAMLDEVGDWAVNDADGLIIGSVLPSLREALKAAMAYSEKGETVRAISRLPPDGIIVFAGQMDRLLAFIVATPIDGLQGAWEFGRKAG
jgi:hypothetical protein